MMIKTERTAIRPVIADDWRQIQRIWQGFARSAYARYDRPLNTDDNAVRARIAKWAEFNASGTEHRFFAVCLGDTVIGYCAFNQRENGYEIGYCFDPVYHGRGYAKESISALLAYLNEQGIKRFTAGTALSNTPSVALLRSLGFRQIGTEKISFYQDAGGNDITFDGGVFAR